MHLQQCGAELRVRVRVFALRHRHAIAFGHQLERLKKTDAFDFHDELEDVPRNVAAEAVVKLVAGMDGERGCLFGMKRAQPGVPRRAAHFLQTHVFFDDFNDIDG